MKNYKKLNKSVNKLENKSYKELSFVNNFVFWVESIDKTYANKNAIFVRPFNEKNAIPQNLTGDGFFLKSYFHGYGGKSYRCLQIKNKFYLIWIDQNSKAIWCQIFEIFNSSDSKIYLKSLNRSKQLSCSIKGNFDSSFSVINGNLLVGLVELNDSDFLFSVDLEKENQDLKFIKKFKNFAGSLSSYKDNNILS